MDHTTPLLEKEKAGQIMMSKFGGTGRSERQKAWVLRSHSQVAQKQAWRPKVMHRMSARKFLNAVDNQIAGSTHLRGWVSFRPTASALWQAHNWQRWPHAGISIDGGPDCVCGVSALEYKWKINVTKFMDHSHQKHRALDNGLGVVGLSRFGC